ncbi:APC family permease [Agromyces subbeticus]|uniref:APC family permease n=1 Tax=Agromyces subbeticus TaxID=293890 RepID=UPI0003B50D11|nr:APC family permease [Agromyces subbeticus]
MRALERAIAERQPIAGLETTSPVHGLRRRTIGGWDVTGQSVAAVAPAGVVLVNPLALGERAGSFAFVSLLVTLGIAVLLALTISVFARRIASTGSLYTFVARGLGPVAGIVAGVALALGYGGIAASTLMNASRRSVSLIGHATGAEPPGWLLPAVIVGFGVIITTVIACGLRLSTRVMLVIEILAVAMILTVSIVVLNSTGWNLADLVPDLSAPFDPGAVLAGVGVALVAFIGFESGTGLGPETRRPLATIPRALLWTVLGVGVVYLIGAAAQLSGDAAPSAGPMDLPLVSLAADAGLSGLGPLIDLIIALSFLACALASTTALVRLAFAMSREQLLPAAFGRTWKRFGTPALGAAIIAAGVTAVPCVWIAATGAGEGLRSYTSPAAVCGYIAASVLLCIAAPVFLVRIGEFTWRSALFALICAGALASALAHYVVTANESLAPGLVLAVVLGTIAVVACLFRMRRLGIADRLGLYDSPVASDSIGGLPGRPAHPAAEPGAQADASR